MISKEALEELLYCASLDDSGFEPTMKSYAEIIKKDLEVLEILKNHVSIFNTAPQCQYPDLIILQGSKISIDEARIINRWLKNN